MRITCPNCGAQYEVPDEVIPDDGRDVQCSNCGDTWFQSRDAQSRQAEAPATGQGTPAPRAETPPEPEPEPPAEPAAPAPTAAEAPAAEAAQDLAPEPEPETETAEAEAEAEAEPAPKPKPRDLDPSVASILREEAEHEARLRAAEAGGLESQAELGLDQAPADEASRRSREVRDRMARMRGETPEEVGAEPAESRRGMLPDIDDINSTLRAEAEEASQQTALDIAVKETERRGGFARGFSVVLLVTILLVLVYVNAEKLSRSFPAAQPTISAYVGKVDQVRIWLDSRLSRYIPQ